MNSTLERTPAQFFFEVGYGAAYAEALIRNNMAPPFELSDALVEHAWEIASEAHEDPAEFDRYLALANAPRPSPSGEDVERALYEAKLQLEYLDERFPTGSTPGILARINDVLSLAHKNGEVEG